jgi:hypothetical protein
MLIARFRNDPAFMIRQVSRAGGGYNQEAVRRRMNCETAYTNPNNPLSG